MKIRITFIQEDDDVYSVKSFLEKKYPKFKFLKKGRGMYYETRFTLK